MSGDTRIRWTSKTWNPMTGCTEISPGCDHCYARVIAERWKGRSFPNGFTPTLRESKLHEPASWKAPAHIFVNSMSDVFHPFFVEKHLDYIDAVFDEMMKVDRHVYQILTKRPKRMRDYLIGTGEPVGFQTTINAGPPFIIRGDGYLARRNLGKLPDWIWPGTTIENDLMTFRADVLREIPSHYRFISAEPLLTPLASLNLDGIAWLIVGGESGPGFRPMPHEWAADLRRRSLIHEPPVAYFFKQSAAYQTERGQLLEGERWEQVPVLERERKRALL